MDNWIGKSIGRYHILEQIGEGGMAIVYKAYDTHLESEVALKVIRTDLFPPAALDRVLKRFEREAKALARLNHPNIVKVIDYGEHDGSPYLVMSYLPGGTLKERTGQRMPWQDAISLLIPIARALAYAHSEGLLHRDVKPSNILITKSGEPVLTDFGIAKLLEPGGEHTLTGTGVGVGTPEYMAPEQGLGKDVDERADVYALGVVLYEMVTGRKPYTADTPIAVVVKQVNDPLPRPSQLAPGLPAEVEQVLFTALAKKPEDRYASMADLAAALEKMVSPGVKASGKYSRELNIQNPVYAQITHKKDLGKTSDNFINGQNTQNTQVANTEVKKTISSVIPIIMIGLIILIGGILLLKQKNVQNNDIPIADEVKPTREILSNTPEGTREKSKKETSSNDSLKQSQKLRIGLVTDVGRIDDKAYNQSAWEGVQKAAVELNAEAQFIETYDSNHYYQNIAAFANEGFDIVVTVGFALRDATSKAAMNFPDTRFIGIDQYQSETINNLVGLEFPEDQAGFLAGALAAQISNTGKIGAVCGTDAVPLVWRYGEGYRAGATYINPDIFVDVIYHNDVGFDKTFTDPDWGYATATSLIKKGTDVIFTAGGKTGVGALLAVADKSTAENPVYAIGVDFDQYYAVPEAQKVLVSSAMKMITPGVYDLILLASQNKFPSGKYVGKAGYASFHELESDIPAEVKVKLDEIEQGLKNGSIQTNVISEQF